jgi:hypothetical protein
LQGIATDVLLVPEPWPRPPARNDPQAQTECCHTKPRFQQVVICLRCPNDRECHGFSNKPARTCCHGMTSEGFCSCRAMR